MVFSQDVPCGDFHLVTDCLISQKDDPDGEICLQYCVKVSECNVDKNYGFLIEVCILLNNNYTKNM